MTIPSEDKTTHLGIVQNIEKNKISIAIDPLLNCESCHSKTSCTLTTKKDKVVVLKNYSSVRYKKDGKVKISCQKSLEIWASLWAYFFPTVLLIATVLFLYYKTKNDVISCLGSLSVVGLYYLVLYFFKHSFSRNFAYTISKV